MVTAEALLLLRATGTVSTVGASPQTMLRGLLEGTLTESELRRLLFDTFGRQVLMALPSGTPAEVFFAAVDVLDRKGLITRELFSQLVELLPGKHREIFRVAEAWGIDLNSVGPGGVVRGVLTILEELCKRLDGDDPVPALELVRRSQGVLFPPSGDIDVGGRVEQKLTLWTEPNVLVIETTRTRRLSSGFVASAYYFLLGKQTPLLRPRGAGGRRGVWMLSDECSAKLDGCLAAYRSRQSPFEYHGDCHAFVGSRSELSDNDRLAAWTAAKDEYARAGFHVRTAEGLIDEVASRALGSDWYSLVPEDSPLCRPS